MKLFTRIILLATLVWGHHAVAEPSLLQLLKTDNHVALMRHALAPGTGDPANFSLRDCSTQRNLDDQGRSQATATGDFLRAAGIEFHTVYSSQWCRCLETAKLFDYGAVVELPVVNSSFNPCTWQKTGPDSCGNG